MSTARLAAIATTASIVLLGTLYSLLNDSYLDTSDPLLTALPHPLHATDYFANKRNPLNVYFTKNLWAWTTLAFLLHFSTSPRPSRTYSRLVQYLFATTLWLAFTGWFFGPPVFDRLIASTGGVCVVHLPTGKHLDVPHDLCFSKTPVSPQTHPHLFPASSASSLLPPVWTGTPRLRKGHDVSGHIFLLTVTVLFLVDQLRSSFATVPGAPPRAWSPSHTWAVAFTATVVATSLLSIWTTSVYFHTPLEKLTGYVLGLVGYYIVHISSTLGVQPTTPHARPVALERRTS